jgi:hypothetical protein
MNLEKNISQLENLQMRFTAQVGNTFILGNDSELTVVFQLPYLEILGVIPQLESTSLL